MLSRDRIESFLREVDMDFPIPLSHKVDISSLAKKYCEKATMCCRFKDDRIIAMVAGYLDHTIDRIGYISLVAAVPDERKRGYSSALLKEFLELAKKRGLKAVHVYTHKTNVGAIRMYRKLGFEDYDPREEPRPEDCHFIMNLNR